MTRFLMLLFLCVPLTACYYMQAASGQWELMRKRQPIAEVIADPETSPQLAARLRLLSEARDFSVAVLDLPDNKSYRSYADLQREFVVWNVFAAPEFSMAAKQWCFPIAGCVSYRGYFSKEDAVAESGRLADEGYDVAVGGVAAYSTLGKFSDPILSTMMRRDDIDLIAVLFHELAHQVVYVKGDTEFNESFATAVEEIGVQLWLEARGEQQQMADYVAARDLQQLLLGLVSVARADLETVFESDIEVSGKRVLKRERLETLAQHVAAEMRRNGKEDSGWLSGELNNARLISMTLYEGQLPSFRTMYVECKKSLPCFYTEAKRIGEMNVAQRATALSAGN